nr:hypothetical protein [Tanacetum cinerariifolium]
KPEVCERNAWPFPWKTKAPILAVSVMSCPAVRDRAVSTSPLDNPFYYLENFRQVLGWIGQRYDDLLDDDERRFIEHFARLSQPSQALLVRMVMRKGTLFRASKLNYAEIGDVRLAAAALLECGWVDAQPHLDLHALFALLRKDELGLCFRDHGFRSTEKKSDLLERLLPLYAQAQPLDQWFSGLDDVVFGLEVMPLCDRLRLLYFGNLYQEWSEFVLADLGIYRYEKVEFSVESRGIGRREDIDTCLHLHACRQALDEGAVLLELADQAMRVNTANPWLAMRRAKLLFQIGYQAEREQDWPLALSVYTHSSYPGARVRRIRVLERIEHYAEAMALLLQAQSAPENDEETQHLLRIQPRLQRKLGQGGVRRRTTRTVTRLDLSVVPLPEYSVERLIQLHLAEEGSERAQRPAQPRLLPASRDVVRRLSGATGRWAVSGGHPAELRRQVRPAITLRLLGHAHAGTPRASAALPAGAPPQTLVPPSAARHQGQPHRHARPDPVLPRAA